MCGIVGMLGDIDITMEKAFKEMLLWDMVRGPHSTGVLSVGPANTDLKLVKKAMNSCDFLQHKPFEELMRGRHRALIGHNRWATKGKVNNDNAHPFNYGHITGVHNGTLKGQHLLDKHTYFDVDSENIYYHMSVHGIEDTAAKLHGAYALVWYDESNASINFFRNGERELYLGSADDGSLLTWASEEWMIEGAMTRDNRYVAMTTQMLPIHTHVSYKLPVSTYGKVKLDKPSVRQLKVYKPPVIKTTAPKTSTIGRLPAKKQQETAVSNILYAAFLGKTVKFEVVDYKQMQYNSYLEGTLVNNPKIFVRAYLDQNDSRWDWMLNSVSYFEAKAKRLSSDQGKMYLVLDLRSISSVVPTLEDEIEDVVVGFNDKLITEGEYLDLMDKGCNHCKVTKPGLDDSFDIRWISKDKFICEPCLKDIHSETTRGNRYVN